ncbi:Tubulin polyglutamylase complex subunit 2 isoform 3 [Schistosoma japonicum]|uniref:Tubulin polyglutamylase complex subunit 2 isoform 3 n=2 Tax=Schistosoma japonicum TaxID=6182 RepID=A0A4Z2DAJ2_SCHJA|nr:Tubulin polyglutamylase complex subunit 2 isoform 3 [Schistosoma japonicum]
MVLNIFQDLKDIIVNKPGVCSVYLDANEPVLEDKIKIWESFNGLSMPNDLKNFYLTTNGIELGWCNTCNEQMSLVGRIKINTLEDFKSIKLNCSDLSEEGGNNGDLDILIGNFLGSGFKKWPNAYELEKCVNGSTVIFVFDENQKGVFLLNIDLSIHKICYTFQQYIRLAVVHLGLQDWQLWYTDDAPIPSSQHLCSLYTPERLYLYIQEPYKQFPTNLEKTVPVSFDSKKLLNLESSSRLDRSCLSGKMDNPLGISNKQRRYVLFQSIYYRLSY